MRLPADLAVGRLNSCRACDPQIPFGVEPLAITFHERRPKLRGDACLPVMASVASVEHVYSKEQPPLRNQRSRLPIPRT